MRLETSNLFCKLRTHHVEAAQEEWTEQWGMESSSEDTDVYMSTTRAQYAHGRKNEKFY